MNRANIMSSLIEAKPGDFLIVGPYPLSGDGHFVLRKESQPDMWLNMIRRGSVHVTDRVASWLSDGERSWSLS